MNRTLISKLLVICLLGMACSRQVQKGVPLEKLSTEFRDPGRDYRPGAFWDWLNGNMSEKSVSRDIGEMSDKGMGRAEIWDVAAVNNPDDYIPAGPAFLSDSSASLIKYAIAEGKRKGIKIGMVGSSGWNAGGPWVEPAWASKQLFYSTLKVKGPVTETLELPFPAVPRQCPLGTDGKPVFYREVAVLAVPDRDNHELGTVDEVIDLTGKFANGRLNAVLPDGNWIILRFICSNNGQRLIVPSPRSGGLFIDFLDPQSTHKHLKHIMDRLGFVPGDTTTPVLADIEFDSMELAEGIPWTDSMPGIFSRDHGYSLIRYLPVLAGWKVPDVSGRFLYDWKKTISDRLIFSHYITGREFLKKYGIELVAEAGGPGPPTWSTCPVDALKALGNVTIPRGEFWVQHRNIFLVKEVSSASHIYSRGIVDAESFTTWRRWKDSPFDLKQLVDRAYCEGLNCVTFHTFASTNPEDGLPGRTYHAGSDINPANTWWNKSKPFMDYLARCNYLLRQGLFVADACYYYGDQAPNFYPAYHWVPEKPLLESLGEGYDYDVVNSDVILNRMSVSDGRIVLPDGMGYRVLVLPDQDEMPLEVLRKLASLVREGATLIGRKPVRIPYLRNCAEDSIELAALAGDMWKGIDGGELKINRYGKGRVVYGLTAREVLAQDGIGPDFSHPSQPGVDYIHRRSGDTDIYFIRNKSGEPWSGDCSFRVAGKIPEIWDPATGEQKRMEDYRDRDGRTDLDLDLATGGSMFVVFTPQERSLPVISLKSPASEIIAHLDRNWKVTFPEGWGAPAEAFLDTLYSWTDSPVEGIRYFSGTAAYHHSFTLDDKDMGNARIDLDLGNVRDLAEVFVNGKSAGILWKPPFVADITPFVHPGNNELRIEVVNQWVNRLTGDMHSDPAHRFCRTNQPYITRDNQGFDNWPEGGDETFRVQTSGLLGPVNVIKRQE
jgi:hypothetical protein